MAINHTTQQITTKVKKEFELSFEFAQFLVLEQNFPTFVIFVGSSEFFLIPIFYDKWQQQLFSP